MRYALLSAILAYSAISFAQTSPIGELAQVKEKIQGMANLIQTEVTYCNKTLENLKKSEEFRDLGPAIEVSEKDMNQLHQILIESLTASCEALEVKRQFISLMQVDDVSYCGSFEQKQKGYLSRIGQLRTPEQIYKEYSFPKLLDDMAKVGRLACKGMTEAKPQVEFLKRNQ